jgi:hypothetical protein
MIAVTPSLRALLAEHHVLLRLASDDDLVFDQSAVVPDVVIQRLEANRPRLVAELNSERDEWLHHWRGLMQDLIDGFDRYMSDDCTDAEYNRWVGLFNLTEYTEVEVLRSRYGLSGCPAEGGVCDRERPLRCQFCTGK